MELKTILINNFRNIFIASLDVENNLIIKAPNKKGKTNTLNAIHWAFTGVTLDGSSDNRLNFRDGIGDPIEVKLGFNNGFTFARRCEMVEGTPTVKVLINGEECETIKKGEAILHSKLGLIDFILNKPSGFDVVRFLLNPLYFDTLAPKTMRTFMYKMAGIDFEKATLPLTKAKMKETLNKYGSYDPYILGDSIAKEKKRINENLKICKSAPSLFPSIAGDATILEKSFNKELIQLKGDEALVEKYALNISKFINNYYKETMGIEVCLLEKGVGEDVFKDVCYPLSNGMPFSLCSYAEKTLIAAKFVKELCTIYKINPLPFLVDNMESLDANTKREFDNLGVRYIGAAVKEE